MAKKRPGKDRKGTETSSSKKKNKKNTRQQQRFPHKIVKSESTLKKGQIQRGQKARSSDSLDKHRKEIVPFESEHRILLVGEGNFSFANSLLEHHGCYRLHATCLDSRAVLESKYPQASQIITNLQVEEECHVEFEIDATNLGRPGVGGVSKAIRAGMWDRIVFNFPHVGGLSKDVNRQVRSNQALLVGFFESSKSLLAPDGQILVTIFEGQPYELWNVRNLARHSGLRVERSFAFHASAYPGYTHARTLGSLESGGGWKGEDRPARTFVLMLAASDSSALERSKKLIGSDSDGP